MFSQACVKNSGKGVCMVEDHAWQEGMQGEVGGHVWQGDMHGRGACMVGVCVAGKMATAADGTHPAGMHSC